jgi:hypothetical protein
MFFLKIQENWKKIKKKPRHYGQGFFNEEGKTKNDELQDFI